MGKSRGVDAGAKPSLSLPAWFLGVCGRWFSLKLGAGPNARCWIGFDRLGVGIQRVHDCWRGDKPVPSVFGEVRMNRDSAGCCDVCVMGCSIKELYIIYSAFLYPMLIIFSASGAQVLHSHSAIYKNYNPFKYIS